MLAFARDYIGGVVALEAGFILLEDSEDAAVLVPLALLLGFIYEAKALSSFYMS
jgi:hypothetical protein